MTIFDWLLLVVASFTTFFISVILLVVLEAT
jgi:hypothetical protein